VKAMAVQGGVCTWSDEEDEWIEMEDGESDEPLLKCLFSDEMCVSASECFDTDRRETGFDFLQFCERHSKL
jgi:hypothetical protein